MHAELDGDQPLALLAVDRRGAGAHELASRVGLAVLAHRRHEVAQPQARRVGDRVGRVDRAAAFVGRALPGRCRWQRAPVPGPGLRTTWLLVMSTGMSRIDVSLPRSRLGQRTVMSNSFSPSIMRGKALPPRAPSDDVVDVGALTPHFLHFSGSTRNSRFDLALDVEDADVLDAVHASAG